jgi:hypothetical protein
MILVVGAERLYPKGKVELVRGQIERKIPIVQGDG